MGVIGVIVSIFSVLLVRATASNPKSPSVIIVGAGMSGISAAKTLSDAGITNLLILEATDHIGGRMHNVKFAGVNVELGANWVEGVNGDAVNPIWTLANKLKLRNFHSDFFNLSSNIYKQDGGIYKRSVAQLAMDRADEVSAAGEKLSKSLTASGQDDISVLAMQRLNNHVPSTPLDMVVDYYGTDYEFAEPPSVTSLQNTVPLSTFNDFGDDVYFVADQRGYKSIVYHLGYQFLKTNKNGTIIDSRLKLNKFPYKFWPDGNGTEFFLYASERRGYYPIWQQLEKQYPGAHVLLVTVTDEESRRIEQQPDSKTKAEAMEVLRKMFGKNIPDATDILVPRWWSDRFYKGSYSNWPIGVNRYEYDQIRAPVGRVYFTGEHTSTQYNGYVHGAYLAGIDSANMMISCIQKGICRFQIMPKEA